MKRLWVVPIGVLAALAVMMAPVNLGPRGHIAFLVAVLVLAAVVVVAVGYWIVTIAELLRIGPGTQREWWFAALAVVVLLGPLGALAYHLAAPSLTRTNDRSLNH